jgi:hypothetical protein
MAAMMVMKRSMAMAMVMRRWSAMVVAYTVCDIGFRD